MNKEEFQAWLEGQPDREYKVTDFFHPTFEGAEQLTAQLVEVWGKHNEKGEA